MNNLEDTPDTPYISHNNTQLRVFYDPPHLLKNVRSGIKSTGFIVDGNAILWSHIVDMLRQDQEISLKMCPRLTQERIDLPMFTKMKVRLTAQTLSHSVAAGLHSLSPLGLFPKHMSTPPNYVTSLLSYSIRLISLVCAIVHSINIL